MGTFNVSVAMVLAEYGRAVTQDRGAVRMVAVVVVVEYSNTQIAEIIDEYIHSERDRAILKRRLIDGLTYECLAEEFDMSVRQIKSIVYKGQERIFSHM